MNVFSTWHSAFEKGVVEAKRKIEKVFLIEKLWLGELQLNANKSLGILRNRTWQFILNLICWEKLLCEIKLPLFEFFITSRFSFIRSDLVHLRFTGTFRRSCARSTILTSAKPFQHTAFDRTRTISFSEYLDRFCYFFSPSIVDCFAFHPNDSHSPSLIGF